jgi:hypothetical protein
MARSVVWSVDLEGLDHDPILCSPVLGDPDVTNEYSILISL